MIREENHSCNEECPRSNALSQTKQRKGCPGKKRKRRRVSPSSSACAVVVLVVIMYFWMEETNESSRTNKRRSMVVVSSFVPPLSRTRIAPIAPLLRSGNQHLLYPSPLSLGTTSKKSSRFTSSHIVKLWMTTTMVTSNTTSAAETVSPSKDELETNTTEEGTQTKMSIIRTTPTTNTNKKNYVPPEELDQLLDKIDIVALIESYGLPGFQKTSPYNAKCICPFHDDRNPSLQINGERGIYKCFSCGAGGSALKFVREYSALYDTNNDEGGDSDPGVRKTSPLTFVEAVNVLKDFAETAPIVVRKRLQLGSKVNGSTNSTGTKKKRASLVGRTSRSRILHANLFAAAYFEGNLFGLPSAGLARTHLRTRGIRPATVKAYSMGFAPESYFFDVQQPESKERSWGEGSLVHKLRDEGFTPQEILDAGLAILTKKGKDQQMQSDSREETGDEKTIRQRQPDHKDFSTIMDRFRGRLVVPIFDATGTHVLGFGGRVLEDDSSSDFKAAKYLNSPESVVFQKKQLLFGQHLLKFVDATDTAASSAKKNKGSAAAIAAAQRRPRSLIIVEGYMDAIALWQAGVKETVASMGTALTPEQLLAGAGSAKQIGGRIVLCLDNDTAGVAAVTRLCSGPDPILLSITEETNVEIFVAQLPESVKDPAEFLEENRGVENLDEKFRAEVIDGAQEWSKWYMNSLLAVHDPSSKDGEEGSFARIFYSLASFLSVFESLDDRMQKSAYIAPKLADLIDKDETNGDSDVVRAEASTTTRIQVASNLVEKAGNIAHLKSTNAQRTYQATIGSSRKEPIVSKSLEISQDITMEEGRRNNPNMKTKSQPTPPSIETNDLESAAKRTRAVINVRNNNRVQQQKPQVQRQRMRLKRRSAIQRSQKSMTKHIAGIGGSPFDDEWLGVTRDKYTNERHTLRFELGSASNIQKYVGPENGVRFNKNNYHGTWTTPEATAAGYMARSDSQSLDFLEKGTSSLVESNGEERSLFVEDLLLSTLVRFSEARQSLFESIRISQASGSGNDIQWSAPEKEWLFKCLVKEIDEIPEGIVGSEDLMALRLYLSNRPDVSPGAFSSTEDKLEDVADEFLDISTSAVEIPSEPDEISLKNRQARPSGDIPLHADDLDFSAEQTTQTQNLSPKNKIPKIPAIPAIGEEWSDMSQTDFTPDFGDDMMSFGGIDDALMDSVGPIELAELDGDAPAAKAPNAGEAMEVSSIQDPVTTTESHSVNGDLETPTFDESEATGNGTEIMDQTEKSGYLDAKFVVAEEGERMIALGSLDQYFMRGLESYDIFNKYYADEDTISSGSNEDKANWAVQDLYTMLQFTTVLKRVEAGRKYMGENKEDWFNKTETNNYLGEADGTETSDGTASVSTSQQEDLSRYCSSRSSEGGLRRDLQRLRSLIEKNNQATDRILALMEADFTDRSADVRGYSWLGNVLKFNELKMVEWNDIIESKENFRPSFEGFEDLEDIVFSDWNELSDPNEMYEFDKNVDLNHRSHFADLVIDRADSESPEDFARRVEGEWEVHEWEQEYNEQHGIEEATDYEQEYDDGSGETDEFLEEYHDEWGDYEDAQPQDFDGDYQ